MLTWLNAYLYVNTNFGQTWVSFTVYTHAIDRMTDNSTDENAFFIPYICSLTALVLPLFVSLYKPLCQLFRKQVSFLRKFCPTLTFNLLFFAIFISVLKNKTVENFELAHNFVETYLSPHA